MSLPELDVGYEADGPADGLPVVLLHGWPDDVRTWDPIAPALHSADFRTLAPYLRGFGPTRFRHADTPRSGQLTALGVDVLNFADAVGLERFAVVGHDWGVRAAYIAACLAPERVIGCVSLSVGWGTNDPGQLLTLTQTQNYWYHWLMAVPRGEALVRGDRRHLARYIWTIWNPGWTLPDPAFEATAPSFENPDWADVTLHPYRVRWGHAEPDPRYAAIEHRLASDPIIRVPTLTLHGGRDPCNDPATSDDRDALFEGFYRRVVLPGLGPFPQRQAPDAVLGEILPFLKCIADQERVAGDGDHTRGATNARQSVDSISSFLSAFAGLLGAKPPSLAMLDVAVPKGKHATLYRLHKPVPES